MSNVISRILTDHGADADSFHESAKGDLHGQAPGDQATELWVALRKAFPKTGLWPIIRGEILEPEKPKHSFKTTLARAPSGPVRKILAQRSRELCRDYADIAPELDPKLPFERLAEIADATCIYGEEEDSGWPESGPGPAFDFQAIKDPADEEILETVGFALVPVKRPYEAVARLGFTGGEAAPSAALLTGVLREWGREYGGVPVSITDDIIECAVDRPPRSRKAAASLAAEQWILCEDIVSQGTQSVRGLAYFLWRSRQWYFWWD
jgi:hypothetical protein